MISYDIINQKKFTKNLHEGKSPNKLPIKNYKNDRWKQARKELHETGKQIVMCVQEACIAGCNTMFMSKTLEKSWLFFNQGNFF